MLGWMHGPTGVGAGAGAGVFFVRAGAGAGVVVCTDEIDVMTSNAESCGSSIALTL